MKQLTARQLRQLFPITMRGLSAVLIEHNTADLVYSDGRRRLFNFFGYEDLIEQLDHLEEQAVKVKEEQYA